MYFHASVLKLIVLALITIVLSGFLFTTMEIKQHFTGSTPSFYAFTVFPRYLVASALAGLESAGRNATAALSFRGGSAAAGEHENTAQAVPVLTYHRILEDENATDVSSATFDDQMRTLKAAGWESITLTEFKEFMRGERTLPERSFLLTFDDGAKDSFYPVDPILHALEYEAAIFVIVQSSNTPETTYYLSPEELRVLLSTGRWDIGSHSYDGHRPYPVNAKGTDGLFFADRLYVAAEDRLETREEFRERVRDDLIRARLELERRFGGVIDTFAFPLGNESGIEGVSNYASGPSVTEEEARNIYSFGFLQTDNQGYTFNYPNQDAFLAWRIHVDHDWDGARLLSELEGGLPKDLPFEDDFSTFKGWRASWGTLERGRNNLVLRASSDRTSASVMLDGSKLWNAYSFDASLDWTSGSAFLLADVADAKTYYACAFSPGVAEVQATAQGATRVLARVEDPRIRYSSDARAGVRVHGSVIECTWDYESIVEAYERRGEGGIGIQAWNEAPGTASLRASSVLVRPLPP